MEYLKEPLKDILISRPIDRVSWGIPVPDDDTHTVYVWLDALINYLTSARYPNPKVRVTKVNSLHTVHAHSDFKQISQKIGHLRCK